MVIRIYSQRHRVVFNSA